METHQFIDQEEAPKRRPVFLTVLGILTFVSTGFGVLGLLLSLVNGPSSDDEVERVVAQSMTSVNELREMGATYMADQMEKIARMNIYINENFYPMLMANFVTLVFGIGGVILMWRGRKLGFHSYIIYNLLSILGIYVTVPAAEVPSLMIILGVIFSAIFIFMYSRNLKWMK